MIELYKHLLPNARAWRLTTGKRLRQFFEGLTGVVVDTRSFFDSVYEDLSPQKTRELDEWERQFALPDTGLSDEARRERLAAAWRAQGGQSPRYIQDTLRQAGFDVYIHEWWGPNPEHPVGGSVNGDVTPVARDPFLYLWDGVSEREYKGCGHDLAYCGGDAAFSNSQNSVPGYPLVNKIIESTQPAIGCGHRELYCAGIYASSAGSAAAAYTLKTYAMPPDPDTYPYYFYVGGETFPELATVPLSRKNEFETLCLKISPLEQWIGILVDYT